MSQIAPAPTSERRSALRWSIWDGVFYSLMLGTSETYLGALAVELGHRDLALSLLATVPLLTGALAQLATPWLMRRLDGEKPLVVAGATLQALSHVGLFAMAWTGSTNLPALLAIKILYWTSNAAIAPAWNAWMARLVPASLRPSYFARRNFITHAGLLISFVVAGALLEVGQQWLRSALPAFAGLYGLALLARLASAFAISRQSAFRHVRVTLAPRRSLGWVLRHGRWRVAAFMAALLFGTQLALPFFTPYMLEELGLDFFGYALLSSLSIGAKGVAFPFWRRARRRFRPLPSLALCTVAITLVPLLWWVATDVTILVAAQILGGAAWAGYDLISLELLFGDAPEEGAVEFFALASSLAGLTQLAGAALAGWALRGGATYDQVFIASAIGRGVALAFLLPVLQIRDQLQRVRVGVRIIGARVGAGGFVAPVMRLVPRVTGKDHGGSAMDSRPPPSAE